VSATTSLTSRAPAPAADRLAPRDRLVLLVLCGAIFLEGIDVAMLNVAIPSIRADLGLSTGMASGVVSAYVLGYGGFMLLGGRAADIYGRRRMFVGWMAVFVVFSGLGGLATEGWMLLVARFATGVAAAFMTPAGLSIITTGFAEGPRRNRALTIYAATASAGFSLGLVAGGVLTALDWRWVFFAPVVLSVVLLGLALVLLDRAAPTAGSRERLDVLGAFTVTATMLLLVYGVVRLEHPSDGPWTTVAVFAAEIAMLAAFIAVERRATAPIVRLGIVRSAPLARANVGAALFAGSFFGFQFLMTLYLQELRGWSTVQTGLALLVIGIDAVLAPVVTPRLVARYGNVRVVAAGFTIAAVAYALLLPIGVDWSYAAMLPTMVLLGVAFTLAYGPLTIAATDGIAEHEQGLAGGMLNTSFQFGAALGVSVVTAVHVAAQGGEAIDAVRRALLVPVVAAVSAAIVTATGIRRRSAARV
jgi:MFS family permease